MNFLSFERLTPEPETAFTRVETLSVDSRGIATLKVEWLPRCAQGQHLARSTGLCRLCEQEWVRAQGQITRVEGWFNECLKVLHAEVPVLLAQGWELDHRTAEHSYLKPPEGDKDVLIPLYLANSLPLEQVRAFTLKTLPFLREPEFSPLTKVGRADLIAYKRLAPRLLTLEAHIAHLAEVSKANRP